MEDLCFFAVWLYAVSKINLDQFRSKIFDEKRTKEKKRNCDEERERNRKKINVVQLSERKGKT